MILSEIPNNPTLIYMAIALGTVLFTKGFDLLIKKTSNSKEIKIAELSKDVDSIENVRKDLEEAYLEIKRINNELSSVKAKGILKDQKIINYETMLRHLQFVLTLLSRQLMRRLKDDPESLALLTEVSNYIETIKV